jgi:hypothetical protein
MLFENIAGDGLQLFLDQVVIIIALGVGGNRATFLMRLKS